MVLVFTPFCRFLTLQPVPDLHISGCNGTTLFADIVRVAADCNYSYKSSLWIDSLSRADLSCPTYKGVSSNTICRN